MYAYIYIYIYMYVYIYIYIYNTVAHFLSQMHLRCGEYHGSFSDLGCIYDARATIFEGMKTNGDPRDFSQSALQSAPNHEPYMSIYHVRMYVYIYIYIYTHMYGAE